MSLIFPKKEILYAPMLGTLGGGSARGFGRGIGGGGIPFGDPFQFTAAGLSGFEGPTTSQVLSVYSGTADGATYDILSDSSQFSVQNGNQKLTISNDLAGTYRITAQAPKGRNSSSYIGGNGGLITGDVTLQAGDVLYIVVGQQGLNSSRLGNVTNSQAYGGSGGSFTAIYRNGWIPAVIAGGGGSAGASGHGMASVLESTISQNRGWTMVSADPTRSDSNGGSGGAGYRGGGGGGGSEYGSAGAGGFFGDGGDGAYDSYYPSANGGRGGDANHSTTADGSNGNGNSLHSGSGGSGFMHWSYGGGRGAGTGYNTGYPPEGGFGCGGSGPLGNAPGGSGGGYSGGGGLGHSNGADNQGGRCGTSYVGSGGTQVGNFTTHTNTTGYVEIVAL